MAVPGLVVSSVLAYLAHSGEGPAREASMAQPLHEFNPVLTVSRGAIPSPTDVGSGFRKPPSSARDIDPLLTAEDVAHRLRVSTDWVWDHSSRKKPFLPVIRMGDGTLRYRQSGIEAFIDERERLSTMGLRRTGR